MYTCYWKTWHAYLPSTKLEVFLCVFSYYVYRCTSVKLDSQLDLLYHGLHCLNVYYCQVFVCKLRQCSVRPLVNVSSQSWWWTRWTVPCWSCSLNLKTFSRLSSVLSRPSMSSSPPMEKMKMDLWVTSWWVAVWILCKCNILAPLCLDFWAHPGHAIQKWYGMVTWDVLLKGSVEKKMPLYLIVQGFVAQTFVQYILMRIDHYQFTPVSHFMDCTTLQ